MGREHDGAGPRDTATGVGSSAGRMVGTFWGPEVGYPGASYDLLSTYR
jgi:hypothetical protein